MIYTALPSSTTPEQTTVPTPASESSVQQPTNTNGWGDADQVLEQLGLDKSERREIEASLEQRQPAKEQIAQWERKWEAFLSTGQW